MQTKSFLNIFIAHSINKVTTDMIKKTIVVYIYLKKNQNFAKQKTTAILSCFTAFFYCKIVSY